jgi:hypothetical protein
MCLKRLTALLENVEACGNDLFNLMPAQYHDRPDSDDPTCLAWRAAADAAVRSYQTLDALREHVAEKVARAEQLNINTQEGRVSAS